MEEEHCSPVYRPAGFYMLRAPVFSANIFESLLSKTTEQVDAPVEEEIDRLAELRLQSYRVLRCLAADPIVAQALSVASSDMFEGLAHLQSGEIAQRRVQRAYAGLLRYLVRMSTRPTPFGLFAGVVVGTLGERTTASVGTPSVERIRTRPDMGWLLSVIQKIEQDPSLVPYLHVVTNRSVYVTDARAILPSADVYGQRDNRSIAIRATSAVRYVLEKAHQPIAYTELRQGMLAAFPHASQQQIDGLLQQLWDNHFLMCDLRPPLTSARPEYFLLESLENVSAAAPLREALKEVIQGTEAIDQAGVGGPIILFQTLKERQMRLLADYTGQYYQVDAALRLEAPQINQEVGEEVADAAEALLRMTRSPRGLHHLREYESAFMERYGLDAEVPLLDLLSPENGLDAPPGYTEPARTSRMATLPVPTTQRRDSILCAWLAEAMHEGRQEIELTDAMLERLTQWKPEAGNAPPTLEMYLQLQAASPEAIDRGEWRGVVAPMGLTYGGRTFCRFFDILSAEGLQNLQAYAKREEELFPDVIFAELSYLPGMGRGANVTIRPPLRSYEIVVNTTPSVPPERVIPLNDLVVGLKKDRFFIRSQRLGKEVVVTQSHMLNPMRSPNVCRFLLEASQDGRPGLAHFDWGVAGNAAFLPRVVRKKIVLSPAQWNLHHAAIEPVGVGSEEDRFFAGLQHWRTRWHVPRYVYLTQSDNRLLLDLEHPLSVSELHHDLKQLDKHHFLVLQEMLPDFTQLWLKDQQNAPYLCELVVPLLLRTEAQSKEPGHQQLADLEQRRSGASSPKGSAAGGSRAALDLVPDARLGGKETRGEEPKRRSLISSKERRKLPGDEWVFLKLYATPRQHDEIITRALPEIIRQMDAQECIDRWFFIRYKDPEPHLRIRFHAAHSGVRDAVLTRALSWSREVADYGLVNNIVLDSYDREIERYGGPLAITMMEQVFTVNSRAISKMVAAIYTRQITLDPLAIAVFSLDQFFALWGLSFPERLALLHERVGKYDSSEAFRSQRRLFCELLLPWDPDYDPTLREQREQLCQMGAVQALTLQQASAQIRALATSGDLWVKEQSLLNSLAHMHINRLLGINREQELRILAFYRHTLESLQRRPAQKRGV